MDKVCHPPYRNGWTHGLAYRCTRFFFGLYANQSAR
jgi:hypothetical protein